MEALIGGSGGGTAKTSASLWDRKMIKQPNDQNCKYLQKKFI